MVVATIGFTPSALTQARLVTLGKGSFDGFVQFSQDGRILNGREVPRFIVHAIGGISAGFENQVQIGRRNLSVGIGTHTTARLDVLQYFVHHFHYL